MISEPFIEATIAQVGPARPARPTRTAPSGSPRVAHVDAEYSKPLLYLDVDGVLNPVCPRPDGEFRAHHIHGSTVLISARHGAWLRELAQVYQLAWASSWEAQANHCISPLLDLPELPVVPVGRDAGGDWLPIVRHAAGRPFAWIDDLIPRAVLRSSADPVDRLLLPVDPGQGLRRDHVNRLLRRPPQLPCQDRDQDLP